jgi:hypothetical protein
MHEPDRTLESWLRVPYEYGRHSVLVDRVRDSNHVQVAYQHWSQRHPLNRLLPRWCVGHPRRVRAVVAAFTLALRYAGPGPRDRVQMALCSGLFNVQYWQGLADEAGLGAGVWRGLKDPSAVTSRHAAAIGKGGAHEG